MSKWSKARKLKNLHCSPSLVYSESKLVGQVGSEEMAEAGVGKENNFTMVGLVSTGRICLKQGFTRFFSMFL